jgi:hypothetical protein
MSPTPTFRVTVVSRSVQAVHYKHRGGASKLDFAGTDLMPGANGQAKVESKKGYIEIEVSDAQNATAKAKSDLADSQASSACSPGIG